MPASATILIPARNASVTIERAVASACAQGDCAIVLVDDFSEDDTVERARRVAGSNLIVIRPERHESLGHTRQTALDAVKTPYGMWLDADDELLPGRLTRMVEAMESAASDFAGDAAELWSGLSGEFIRRLPIPDFIKNHHPLVRLFERNFLPAPGALGFRTRTARHIGFDTRMHGAEDYDFLLRAVAGGARISLLDSVGYRLFAYPQSLSRKADSQRRMCRAALEKHSYHAVRALYRKAGYDEAIALWGLVSVAMFRTDYAAVLQFLQDVQDRTQDAAAILEPGGPCPYPESWRIDFFRGTALLLMGRATEALPILERQYRQIPTAEGCNNLGVAKWHAGDRTGAELLFQHSLQLFPGYMDAAGNLESACPDNITSHPLRSEPARQDY